MLKLKYSIYIIFFFFISLFPTCLTAQLSIGQAAYLVGRQQVLAQKIAQSYLVIEVKLEVHSYKNSLIEAVNTFNSNLKKLEDYAPNDEVAEAMEEMWEAWDEFYRVLMDAPQDDDILDLIKYSYDLLKKADATLLAIENYALSEEAEKVDETALKMLKLAEHQNSLSQHAILYYLAYWNGIDKSKFFNQYFKAVTEYENNFYEIGEASDNLPEIKKQVMENAFAWKKTASILSNMKGKPAKSDLRKVMSSGNDLYRRANQVAKSYEKLVDIDAAAKKDG